MNPFDAEYLDLQGQLQALRSKQSGLQSKLDAHAKTSEMALRTRISNTRLELDNVNRETEKAGRAFHAADQQQKSNKKKLKASWYNPVLALLNLATVMGYEDTLVSKLYQFVALETEKAEVSQRLTREEKALSIHLSFEAQRGGILEAIEVLKSEEAKIEEQLSRVAPLKFALDAELRAPLQEIHHYKMEIRDLQHDIQQAEPLEWILQNSSNGRERAQAYSRCESLFDGDSSPRNVIKARSESIRALERKLKKNENLAQEIVKRHSMVIGAIVIDGSNLCYIGDEFIGLNALVTVANHLSGKYPVSVIFDGNIRRKTSLSDKDIRASFAPAVTVHVMSREGKADEIVLKEAADEHAYVVSGDNYDEYRFLPAVSKGRVLKPEILKTRIYIPAMGLDLTWSA